MSSEPDTILRPLAPQTDSIVRITFENDVLYLTIDHYNEDLRLTAKNLGFIWKRPSWARRITKFNGSAEDRIIEAAYRLLERNLIVHIPSAAFSERIENGDFTDEWTRWIAKHSGGKYDGHFSIRWHKSEDFYSEAKALPGARYSKRHVYVKKEHFEQVADFAQIYDFQISDGAYELIEEAKQAQNLQIRVELKPRKKQTPAAKKIQPEDENREILDELRDDD
jgi:hypothetical protein